MVLDRTLKEHKPAAMVLQAKAGLQAPSLKAPEALQASGSNYLPRKTERVKGGGEYARIEMKRQASDLSQQRRGEHDSPNGSCFLSTGQPASGLPRGSTPRSAAWRRQLCFVNPSGKFSPSARPCRAVDKPCLNSVCLHIF